MASVDPLRLDEEEPALSWVVVDSVETVVVVPISDAGGGDGGIGTCQLGEAHHFNEKRRREPALRNFELVELIGIEPTTS